MAVARRARARGGWGAAAMWAIATLVLLFSAAPWRRVQIDDAFLPYMHEKMVPPMSEKVRSPAGSPRSSRSKPIANASAKPTAIRTSRSQFDGTAPREHTAPPQWRTLRQLPTRWSSSRSIAAAVNWAL